MSIKRMLGIWVILWFVILSSCLFQEKENCPKINGIKPLLYPGQIILIGEIHGTKEAPEYVRYMACQALNNGLEVVVGLELPESDQEVINEFLDSKGRRVDQQKILNLPFWARAYQDGRGSQAMFDLIDGVRKLKTSGHKISVLLIDNPQAGNRDEAMATNVIERAQKHQNEWMIILTGNYHNMIYSGSGQMGEYILNDLGRDKVVSLKQEFVGGSAWVDVAGQGFGPVKLKGYGRNKKGIFLEDVEGSYHGTLEVDSIHYSPPAKDQQ